MLLAPEKPQTIEPAGDVVTGHSNAVSRRAVYRTV